MNRAVEKLILMLDEERSKRTAIEKASVAREELLVTQQSTINMLREDLNEEYARSGNMARELSALKPVWGTPDYKMLYEQMNAMLKPILTEHVVKPIFDKDPAHYEVNKIPFIKEVREASHIGLKDAKDLVDEFLDEWKRAKIIADLFEDDSTPEGGV